MKQMQRGGFVLGLAVGLLLGLALSLGVALWVTKVPVPFVDKVPQRTAEQDAAEAERNRNWDPNAPLATRAPRPGGAASAAVPGAADAPATVAVPAAAPARDPAAILSGQLPTTPSAAAGVDPFTYFVQAGAYTRTEDAEQQRAKLAMLGMDARITEREQSGRTMYRVRVGPYDKKDDAESARTRLAGAGVDAALVRVQRSP
ncbi:MAG: SPOR domain-containing protein [Ideonella sp.]|jgi:cell division protein FtsN|nr:SPOR domain-containing protein [Ideonella sp.]